jgi:uncharacterized phage protein gp47/JayE
MAIVKPTDASAIYNQMSGEFVASVNANQTDPANFISQETINQSPHGVMMKSISLTTDELYINQDINIKSAISLESYYGEDLDNVAKYVNIHRIPAQSASGEIFVQGESGLLIPADSQFIYNDIIYLSTLNKTVVSNTINIASITSQNGIATINFTANSPLFSGCEIVISGNSNSLFNITANIISVELTKLTFAIDDISSISGTGGIITFLGILVPIQAQTTGSDSNIANNVTLESASVDDVICGTTINGLSGGIDQESDFTLNQRFTAKRQNNTQNYTTKQLPIYIKTVYPEITHAKIATGFNGSLSIQKIEDVGTFTSDPDNTKPNVKKITFNEYHYFNGIPATNFLSISGSSIEALNVNDGVVFEVKDDYTVYAKGFKTNDSDIVSTDMIMLPYYSGQKSLLLYKANNPVKTFTPTELTSIKTFINDDVLPAGIEYNVLNLTKKDFTFTFTALSPNISSLKSAIIANLKAYAKDVPTSKSVIKYSEYSLIISSTIDENSNTVQDFTLSNTQDINIAVNEIFDVEDSDVIFNI